MSDGFCACTGCVHVVYKFVCVAHCVCVCVCVREREREYVMPYLILGMVQAVLISSFQTLEL